jgi:hypothetical protein
MELTDAVHLREDARGHPASWTLTATYHPPAIEVDLRADVSDLQIGSVVGSVIEIGIVTETGSETTAAISSRLTGMFQAVGTETVIANRRRIKMGSASVSVTGIVLEIMIGSARGIGIGIGTETGGENETTIDTVMTDKGPMIVIVTEIGSTTKSMTEGVKAVGEVTVDRSLGCRNVALRAKCVPAGLWLHLLFFPPPKIRWTICSFSQIINHINDFMS